MKSKFHRLKADFDDVEQENHILEETCRKHKAQIERLTDLVHEMEAEKSSAIEELLRHQREMKSSYESIMRMLRDHKV